MVSNGTATVRVGVGDKPSPTAPGSAFCDDGSLKSPGANPHPSINRTRAAVVLPSLQAMSLPLSPTQPLFSHNYDRRPSVADYKPHPMLDQNDKAAKLAVPRRRRPTRTAGDIQIPPSYVRTARQLSIAFAPEPRQPQDTNLPPSPVATPPPTASKQSRKIELPWKLPRPVVDPVQSDALAIIDPELAGVPVEFVVHKLKTLGQELLQSLSSVVPPTSIAPSINTSSLPSELELHVRDLTQQVESIPTHLLCVFNPNAGKASKGHLFPAHSLVLASQCSRFPQVGPATRTIDYERGTTRLPVVPLPVPHPASFGYLNAYLYTRRVDKVLATLLPLPTQILASISGSMANQPACSAIPQLSAAMARTFTLPALVDRAGVIHGMWSNCKALGVDDDRLWKVLELAWDIIIASISASSSKA
ncbi:clampless1 Clp1 protein [Ceratobasidium sp. AG-Ba]|nr:clampless1 Clp1 protein [Ceratobasidium sp. AG-Ba]